MYIKGIAKRINNNTVNDILYIFRIPEFKLIYYMHEIYSFKFWYAKYSELYANAQI